MMEAKDGMFVHSYTLWQFQIILLNSDNKKGYARLISIMQDLCIMLHTIVYILYAQNQSEAGIRKFSNMVIFLKIHLQAILLKLMNKNGRYFFIPMTGVGFWLLIIRDNFCWSVNM